MRAVAVAALEPYGFECREAASAATAIPIANDWQPDVILMDVLMPGESGTEACRAIRANPSTCEIPVVLLTGLADQAFRKEAITVGADDVIVKPVNLTELRMRVALLARLNRYRIQAAAVGAGA